MWTLYALREFSGNILDFNVAKTSVTRDSKHLNGFMCSTNIGAALPDDFIMKNAININKRSH